ncbi:MAG: TRAP transporter substrate-binding protein DctP [Desulfosarcinaceae bacterium]|nr:TRAP transporter substrate-binding protein DctP [Desulfosarcinaceae bacterium]
MVSGIGPNAVHCATLLKTAVVMPEGSTWTKMLHEMTEEIERKTAGAVTFQVFAGGISGDEPDVIRKMRVNRLQAAGFSGIGLGVLVPEVRVLESVLLFRDNDEVDRVRAALFDDFARRFDEKGYVLLGFFEAGFTYLYTRRPINGVTDLKNTKMWIWKGDQIATRYVSALGMEAVPLHMTDVNTGLETGLIDGFYAPPLAAMALQWFARVGYVLDYPLVNSCGGFLITKRAFNRLSEDHRQVLREVVRAYCAKLVTITRVENTQAKTLMANAGLRFMPPTDAVKSYLHGAAESATAMNIPAIYPRGLYERVAGLAAEGRSAP